MGRRTMGRGGGGAVNNEWRSSASGRVSFEAVIHGSDTSWLRLFKVFLHTGGEEK